MPVGRIMIFERKPVKMIEARGLYKQFGDVIAVQDLDIDVRAGSVYALLGPNGAGKSTTINMLTTLLQPDRGKLRLRDMRLHTTQMQSGASSVSHFRIWY